MAFDTYAAVKTLTDADADASEPFAVSRLARRQVMDGVAIAAVGVAVTVTHGAVTGEVIPRRF